MNKAAFKYALAKRNITQKQLAESLGVTKQTVSLWERGLRAPDFSKLDPIADYFDVTVAYLVGSSDDGSAPDSPTDEDAARWALEDADSDLFDMMRKYVRLTFESRDVINGAINAAFKMERITGKLKPEDAYEVSVHSKEWVDLTRGVDSDDSGK